MDIDSKVGDRYEDHDDGQDLTPCIDGAYYDKI